MTGLEIRHYDINDAAVWDTFVSQSGNGTFIHMRPYMDYHSQRFSDFSLIIFRHRQPVALLPASVAGDTVASHPGLTYGGLITGRKSASTLTLEIFIRLKEYLAHEGFRRFIYKPVPHIYHVTPAEEDLYALFRLGADLKIRNISSSVDLRNGIRLRRDHRYGSGKAIRNGISIRETDDFDTFWDILSRNIGSKYGAVPVHSLPEIKMLASRFPHNIRLFGAFLGMEMLAGTILYLTDTTVHCQYISTTPYGRDLHAGDLLLSTLLKESAGKYRFFDFGTSNENDGLVLNGSLAAYKEGFGAGSVCYDTYEIPLT